MLEQTAENKVHQLPLNDRGNFQNDYWLLFMGTAVDLQRSRPDEGVEQGWPQQPAVFIPPRGHTLSAIECSLQNLGMSAHHHHHDHAVTNHLIPRLQQNIISHTAAAGC